MSDRRDLQLLLGSGVPIIVIETHDEARFLDIDVAAVERVHALGPSLQRGKRVRALVARHVEHGAAAKERC